MAVTTIQVQETEDGHVAVRNPVTGRLLLLDGVLQPGLTEAEAREAADLLRYLTFEDKPED